MISEEEARGRILEHVRPCPTEELSIFEALNRFAAQDYLASLPLPAFDNSAMDGYAVISAECRSGARLRVVGEQPAGINRHLHVGAGEAVRIFTGAPVPSGSDAVIMQEDVTRDGDAIVVGAEVATGEFVRKRGCDLAEGQKIVSRGEMLRAGTIALLASQGLARVAVGGTVSAAIVATGNELVPPGDKLRSGQIYESNSAVLNALLFSVGARVVSIRHSADDASALQETIAEAANANVVIISGGVSVGEHDLVQSTLRRLGAMIDIWRVAIKPGKPFLFAKLGDSLVFGLPGNPVSAFVTFLKFVRPAILKMMGASVLDLPKVRARLTVDLHNEGERVHYMRGCLAAGDFTPVGVQESHALYGLSRANALLPVAPHGRIWAGAEVDVEVWD